MTRNELILRFIAKARAWDAAEEEENVNPKIVKMKHVRLSVFDLHAIMLLAGRGDGGTLTTQDMQLERRQFSQTAATAMQDLRSLASRDYLEEVGDRVFRLSEKGIRLVNAAIS